MIIRGLNWIGKIFYFLWWDINWYCSQINIDHVIDAWQDKEEARAFGSTANVSAKSENNSSFIFLYDLDRKQQTKWTCGNN